MGTVNEVNERAILAMSLRRRNMTVPPIALYLNTDERSVYKLLARARKLWGLLADASDSKTRIGENLAAFEENERMDDRKERRNRKSAELEPRGKPAGPG